MVASAASSDAGGGGGGAGDSHHHLSHTQEEEGEEGAFSFLWGSEKSGFMHLELHTFVPSAAASAAASAVGGEWVGADGEGEV